MSAADDRAMRARIAAHTRWSKQDGTAGTALARRAFLDRFDRQVDPDGTLDGDERERRAAHARKAYMLDLARRSVEVRRNRCGEDEAAARETTPRPQPGRRTRSTASTGPRATGRTGHE